MLRFDKATHSLLLFNQVRNDIIVKYVNDTLIDLRKTNIKNGIIQSKNRKKIANIVENNQQKGKACPSDLACIAESLTICI